jgi:hypothetical protein
MGDKYEVIVFDTTGRLLRTIRRNVPAIPLTESERESYRRNVVGVAPEARGFVAEHARRTGQVLAQSMVFPSTHRVIVDMQVDPDGNIWLERLPAFRGSWQISENARTEGIWDVLLPDGTLRGTVRMPAGLRLTEIGLNHVAGSWMDPSGIPHARIHELKK